MDPNAKELSSTVKMATYKQEAHRGFNCLYEKRYGDALESFTKALKELEKLRHASDPFFGFYEYKILGGRVHALEKLGEHKEAIKDSYRMMTLMPKKATGYIKCAKLLRLRDDFPLAIKVLERGLEKIPELPGGTKSDSERGTVYFHLLELKRVTTEYSTVEHNPLEFFPPEIMRLILLQLPTSQRLSCMRVHKSWKRFIENQPDLFRLFDTTINVRSSPLTMVRLSPLTIAQINAFTKLANNGITNARVLLNRMSEPKKLVTLVRNNPKIEVLQLCQGFVGATLNSVLVYAKKLTTLILSPSTTINASDVYSCFEISPNLVTVEMYGVEGTGQQAMFPWKTDLPNLKVLTLLGVKNKEPAFKNLNLQTLVLRAPNLRQLNFSHWQDVAQEVGIIDLRSFEYLEVLTLSFCWITKLPALPESLVHLDISSMFHLRSFSQPDQESPVVYEGLNLPNLQSFHCGSTPLLTKNDVLLFLFISQSIAVGNLRMLEMDEMSSGHFLGLNTLAAQVADEETNDEILAGQWPTIYSPLETLSIQNFDASEDTCLDFLRRFPRLKRIMLVGTKVSGVTIKELVERGNGDTKIYGSVNTFYYEWRGTPEDDIPRLQDPTTIRPHAIMLGIHEKTQFDAIDYAQKNGIRVIKVNGARRRAGHSIRPWLLNAWT